MPGSPNSFFIISKNNIRYPGKCVEFAFYAKVYHISIYMYTSTLPKLWRIWKFLNSQNILPFGVSNFKQNKGAGAFLPLHPPVHRVQNKWTAGKPVF
jgi:hypothetical protein